MHCFTHQESPAVCACAFCLKGLCQNCMQPSDDRFVCSSACTEQLGKITKLNKYAMSIYGIDGTGQQKKPGLATAKLYLGLGIPFLGFGIYSALNIGDWGLTCFASASGLVCIAHAYRIYKRGLRV